MAITTVPTFPLRSQGLTQAAYSSGVEASLSAIPTFISDLNAVGSAYALSTNGTSTSSVLVGTGAKTFTTQTGLGYLVGMTLRIANSSTNYMTGEVTSYTTGSGALVMNITSVAGSGTLASWTITMGAVGDLTTKMNVTGGTFAGDISVPDEVYGVGWNANLEVPTKNAVYDKIESVVATIPSIPISYAQGTSVATTSGTSHDFTGLPANTKEITLKLSGVSLSGTAEILVQAIVGGTPVTTGYISTSIRFSNVSTSAGGSSTSGFNITSIASTNVFSGIIKISNLTGNTWVSSHICKNITSQIVSGGGDVALAGAITGIRLTTTGADTFDAGIANISYEYVP